MRLFAGLELDEAVRTRAAAIAETLRMRLGTRVRASWVPAENLHITLWFFGEVAEERGTEILSALDRPFEVPRFDLHIAALGAFPPSGPPRVFWLGVQDGASSLGRVHGELSDRLRPLHIEPERRAYSAHLTIARVKEVAAHAGRRDLRRLLAEIPSDAGACRMSEVTVFRSRLSPKGASYDPLLRVPLQ